MPKTGRRDDWEKTRWIVRSLDLTVALSEMTPAVTQSDALRMTPAVTQSDALGMTPCGKTVGCAQDDSCGNIEGIYF